MCDADLISFVVIKRVISPTIIRLFLFHMPLDHGNSTGRVIDRPPCGIIYGFFVSSLNCFIVGCRLKLPWLPRDHWEYCILPSESTRLDLLRYSGQLCQGS